jgi:hypothetical protein
MQITLSLAHTHIGAEINFFLAVSLFSSSLSLLPFSMQNRGLGKRCTYRTELMCLLKGLSVIFQIKTMLISVSFLN